MSQSIFSDLLPTIKKALHEPQEIVCRDSASARACRNAIYHQRKAAKNLFPDVMKIAVTINNSVVRLTYTASPILKIRAVGK